MTEKAKSGTSGSASAGAGTGNDKPSLDDLLASYKQGDSGREPERAAKPKSDDDADDVSKLTDKMSRLERELADRDYRDAMKERVIPLVKGDTEAEDKYVEWWVNDRAAKDERLQKVWDEKDSNPARFAEAMEALGAEFAKKHGKSSDKDRIANAVRNARNNESHTEGFDNVDWSSLSQDQFELKKRALYKAAERGELR